MTEWCTVYCGPVLCRKEDLVKCIEYLWFYNSDRRIKVQVIQQEKLGLQLRWVLEDRLREALPGVCLSRDGLMKDPPNTLLACSLIATEVLDHLKTSVSSPDYNNEAEECLHGEQLLAPAKVSHLRSWCNSPSQRPWRGGLHTKKCLR